MLASPFSSPSTQTKTTVDGCYHQIVFFVCEIGMGQSIAVYLSHKTSTVQIVGLVSLSLFYFITQKQQMQTAIKSFKINIDTSRLILSLKYNNLKITLINYSEDTVHQETYDEKNLPSATGKNFANIVELYSWLERYKDNPQVWNVQKTGITIAFQSNNILRLSLGKFDAVDLFVCFTEADELKQHIHSIYTELQSLKQREQQSRKQATKRLRKIEGDLDHINSSLAQNQRKIEGDLDHINSSLAQNQREIEVVEQKDKKRAKQLEQLINSQNQKIVQLQQSTAEKIASMQQSFEQHKFDAEISFKTSHRNLMTVKEQLSISCEANKNDIKALSDYITKANLEKIKADYVQIINLFETQIKIKEYSFKPDNRSLQQNKKVYYLNKKSLKCVQDTKDYFKIAGEAIYPFGRYICRFLIKNIKNNGLLLGVCSNKCRNQLQSLPFNDKNLISLNSCGYVINRGAMVPLSWKIKPGDQLNMLVCTSTNEIKWVCNNIEIAHAELGSLRDEQIFPFIGLGNFCDEVQILQDEYKDEKYEANLSYTKELVRLNEKYGSSRRYRGS